MARSEAATARLLARGWLRGSRAWYRGASGALAAALALMVLVSGLFAGMREETESRVADFYTADLRITPLEQGAIPSGLFGPSENGADANASADLLRDAGATVSVRYESQYVLSRRGLVEAGLGEDDRFVVEPPGAGGSEDEVIALGSLVGLDLSSRPATSDIRRHLVSGRLPNEADIVGDPVPLVMSVGRVLRLMTEAEREGFEGRPSIDDVDALLFEITAAVLDDGGNDIIRRPARVVGLYDTGVDILDAYTLVAPIQHVRVLNGHGPTTGTANVMLVHGGAGAARGEAREQGWATQSSSSFAGEYLGQLVDVLQALSLLLAASLFLLPAFLVTHGMSRQLASHQREVAVCRALGVPPRALRSSMARLAGHLVLWAVGIALVAALLLGLFLHAILPGQDLPIPADIHVGALQVLPAVVALAAVGVAVAVAIRSAGQVDLSSTLRAL